MNSYNPLYTSLFYLPKLPTQSPKKQVGFDNLSVMRNVSLGADRGNALFDDAEYEAVLSDFERQQSRAYRYRMQRRRIVAEVDVKGDVDGAAITAAVAKIRAVLSAGKVAMDGRRYRVKKQTAAEAAAEGATKGAFGLQLWSSKIGFNALAQPAIAIYEMQYSSRLTKVFVEIEPVEG